MYILLYLYFYFVCTLTWYFFLSVYMYSPLYLFGYWTLNKHYYYNIIIIIFIFIYMRRGITKMGQMSELKKSDRCIFLCFHLISQINKKCLMLLFRKVIYILVFQSRDLIIFSLSRNQS